MNDDNATMLENWARHNPLGVSTTIVAIDPGLTGAIAFYIPSLHDRVAVYDMPVVDGEVDAHALRDLVKNYMPVIGVIERVGPMPRDGVMQAWRFGSAFTTAKITLGFCGIAYHLITPGVWKKAMGLKGGRENKEQSRKMALRYFPKCASSFARKKDAGRAEAALLAWYLTNIRKT